MLSFQITGSLCTTSPRYSLSRVTAQLSLLWELNIAHLAFSGTDGLSPAPSFLHQHFPNCHLHHVIPALALLPCSPLLPHLNHRHPGLCRHLAVTSNPVQAACYHFQAPQQPWLHIWESAFSSGQPTVTVFITLLLHPQASTSCLSQAVPLP